MLPNWFKQTKESAFSWSFSFKGLSTKAVDTTFTELGIVKSTMLPASLDKLIKRAEDVYKDSNVTTVVQVQSSALTCIVKRYNSRSLLHFFSRAVRPSRAKRCWNMSYRFTQAGLNVAMPMMMCEKRYGPFRLNAYFVSEKLSGEVLLSALPKMNTEQQIQVVEQMNTAFSQMREAKITHGDMKATNLIWHEGRLTFIDLDAAKPHLTQASWQHSHAKDRKRFLKNWQNQPELLALFTGLE